MLVSIGVAFLLTPYIIAVLGKAGYGIWVIITSLIGYYGLLNLGITSAVSRFAALYIGNKDLEALNTVFSTAFVVFLLIALVIVGLSWIVGPYLPYIFDSDYNDSLPFLVLVVGCSVALSFPTAILISLFVAHERYVQQSSLSILMGLLRALLTVFFLERGYGLEGMAYAFLITAVFEFIAYSAVVWFYLPWVRPNGRLVKFNMLIQMLTFGLPTLVITVSGLMRTNLDSVVIGGMVGIEEVAVYSVAALLIRYVFSIANSGLGIFTPRFARLVGEEQDVKPLFFSSLYFASLIAATAGGGVLFFGERFINLWLGDGFEDAIPILFILVSCYVITIAQIPGLTLLMALNKHKAFAAITFVEGIANVVLSVLLAPAYGIVGVALGTAIPMLVVKILIQPFLVSKLAEVSLLDYLKPMLIPILLGMVLFAAPFAFNVSRFAEHFGWTELVLASASFAVVFVGANFGAARALKPALLKLKS